MQAPIIRYVPPNISTNDHGAAIILNPIVEETPQQSAQREFENQTRIHHDDAKRIAEADALSMTTQSSQILKLRLDMTVKWETCVKPVLAIIMTSLALTFPLCSSQVCLIFVAIGIFFTITGYVLPRLKYRFFIKQPSQPAPRKVKDFLHAKLVTRSCQIWKHNGYNYEVFSMADPTRLCSILFEGKSINEFELANKFRIYLQEMTRLGKYKGPIFEVVEFNYKEAEEKAKRDFEEENARRLEEWREMLRKEIEADKADQAAWNWKNKAWLQSQEEFNYWLRVCIVVNDALSFLAILAGFAYVAVCQNSPPYCNLIQAPALVIHIALELHFYCHFHKELKIETRHQAVFSEQVRVDARQEKNRLQLEDQLQGATEAHLQARLNT